MYIGKQPVVGNFQVCDAITVVNGQAAYTMQVSSANVEPENANHMLVSLNGILQKPGSSFTISGATITFASNLATGDSIDFIILLGNVLDIGQPSDGTVTNAKLAQDIISGETALAATPADTDEFLVSDAGTLKRVDYSYIKSAAGSPYFMACKTADQDINDNTATKIQFDGEMLDSGTVYDNSSNYRFTPGVTGIYVISLNVWVYDAQTSLGDAFLYIYKNGSSLTDTRQQMTSDFPEFHMTTLAIVSLDDDDYIEAYMKVDTSDSGTFRVAGSGNNTIARHQFSGFRIA